MQNPATETRVIRDLLDVRHHPTVVRLDDLDANWITEAYYQTEEVRQHLEALSRVFARDAGLGIFLIGQYGSGKSHFLAWVTRAVREGRLAENPIEAVPISLLNFPAKTSLEEIVTEALGFQSGSGDRRRQWAQLAEQRPQGLLLLIDELSEFLRSKPDARSFNEDVRFLQFMGEWAAGRRFWLLAALQEQIEHTGELEYALYRKIKDRFPLRLLLTPSHVRDLLSDSILVKMEGYETAVAELEREVREALPDLPVEGEAMRACYPIHPATLDLLDELRDQFSQARGAVDFAVTQIAGSSERNVRPFLDHPWGSFITPDSIVDHFRDLFEIQPEFLPIAERVFPHYRKHLDELFDTPAQRDLAKRLIKLLILVHMAPAREGLTTNEAAAWLLVRASRLEPRKNLDIVERILRVLAERGRYVTREENRFRLDLKDDGAAALEPALDREKAEIAARGEMLFELIAPLLHEKSVFPFTMPRDRWEPRSIRWHFHERPISVFLGQSAPPNAPEGRTALCVRLPWGDADAVAGATTITPERLSPDADVIELAALVRLRNRPWSPEAKRRLETRLNEQLRLLASRIHGAYSAAQVVGPVGEVDPPAHVDPGKGVAAWIEEHALRVFRRTWPSFERFAPLEGPLPRHAYIELARFARLRDITEPRAPELVQVVREGYLVPMKLLERRSGGYALPKALDRHELVKLIRPILETQPVPKVIYQRLQEPVYGLVPDQVHLLLLFLMTQGELDIVKGRQSYRELVETLPIPTQYDRIQPGRALSLEEIRDLQHLCEGLRIRLPEQWTVLAQRRAAQRLIEVAREQREQLGAFLLRLEKLGSPGQLAQEVRRLLGFWKILDEAQDELEALRDFLAAIGSPARLLQRIQTMAGLPGRIDRLLTDVQRFRHLFNHPAVSREHNAEVAAHIADLGPPPDLDQPDELERWIERARSVYGNYKREYARRHADWWKQCREQEVLSWAPPGAARIRHVTLDDELAQVQRARTLVQSQLCRGLVDLDFQPVCSCGFDGEKAPFGDAVGELRSLRTRIEAKLRQFFNTDAVRSAIAELADAGIERGRGVARYLDRQEPWPDIEDIGAVERKLSGVAVVEELDPSRVVDLLCRATWNRDELLAAFEELVQSWPSERISFRKQNESDREEIALWCAERAIAAGVPLPAGLTPSEHRSISSALRAEWVGDAALKRIEQLGLCDEAVDRLLAWLIDGTIALPSSGRASPLVDAVRELVHPSTPRTPQDLARVSEIVYRANPRLLGIDRRRWLSRLQEIAASPLAPDLPPLAEALAAHRDATWLVIDALSAPLELAMRDQLDALLDKWKRGATEYAFVSPDTTTDSFYRELIAAGHAAVADGHGADGAPRLEKINAVDALVHEREADLDALARMAVAEFGIALKRIMSKLDASRPLLLFADHGFRITPDGRSFTHGGPSTLERLVPVIRYEPA